MDKMAEIKNKCVDEFFVISVKEVEPVIHLLS